MHISLTSFVTRACLASALVWSTACGDDSSTTDGSNDDSTGAATSGSTGDATTGTPATTTGEESTSGNDTTAAATDDGATDETGADSSGGDDTTTGASTGQESLEIGGEWAEDLGKGVVIDHIIDDASWAQNAPWGDSLFHIEDYDNEARWVIAQGDADNESFPGLYNKFNWLWQDETLYYCTAIFDAETPEDAMAAENGDESELENGCFGFAWSVLTAAE
ncbi:MAG: hypothetical protein AAF799_10350 [Myxococcota bacterium]